MPTLRMKTAVTRHLLFCASQDDGDPFSTPRRPRPPSLLAPAMSLPRVRGILQLVWEAIVAKGAGTTPQALRTLHVACAGSIGSWTAVTAVATKPKHHAKHHVFKQTGKLAQFWNYGDESAIGWAQ